MLGLVVNSVVTPAIARRLSRAIPNPLLRTVAVAAVGYGINRLFAPKPVAGRPASRTITARNA